MKLYDLNTDISEQTDLSAKHPDTLKAMIAKLDTWETELVEPSWKTTKGKGKKGGKRGGRKKNGLK